MLGVDRFRVSGGIFMSRIGIIVTGYPGSGSTTLAENIVQKFNWPPHYYSGAIVRWLIDKLENTDKGGFPVKSPEELIQAFVNGEVSHKPKLLSRYGDFPPELDIWVDRAQTALLETKDCGVHEGRVVWYLAKKLHEEGRALDKKIITICCVVGLIEGARRQAKRQENEGRSVEEIVEETIKRLKVERERYRALYGIEDHLDPRNFDIVIDTTFLSKELTLDVALEQLRMHHPPLFE